MHGDCVGRSPRRAERKEMGQAAKQLLVHMHLFLPTTNFFVLFKGFLKKKSL
jgi:hypothetical protein